MLLDHYVLCNTCDHGLLPKITLSSLQREDYALSSALLSSLRCILHSSYSLFPLTHLLLLSSSSFSSTFANTPMALFCLTSLTVQQLVIPEDLVLLDPTAFFPLTDHIMILHFHLLLRKAELLTRSRCFSNSHDKSQLARLQSIRKMGD